MSNLKLALSAKDSAAFKSHLSKHIAVSYGSLISEVSDKLCHYADCCTIGKRMLRFVARLIIKLRGWTATGGVQGTPKAVIIAAPHTSNWDAFWAIVYIVAKGIDVRFFAKHTLFWFPLGPLLRSFGCMPLDRTKAKSVVQQAIDMIKMQDTFYLALAPEGTRSRADGWKSGFYRIALGAGVPVLMGTIDYSRKSIGINGRLDLSGDIEADMKVCAEFYSGVEGRCPEKSSPVRILKKF